jgi:hypothetical protein
MMLSSTAQPPRFFTPGIPPCIAHSSGRRQPTRMNQHGCGARSRAARTCRIKLFVVVLWGGRRGRRTCQLATSVFVMILTSYMASTSRKSPVDATVISASAWWRMSMGTNVSTGSDPAAAAQLPTIGHKQRPCHTAWTPEPRTPAVPVGGDHATRIPSLRLHIRCGPLLFQWVETTLLVFENLGPLNSTKVAFGSRVWWNRVAPFHF